jgi:predicted phosphodiesterase
MAGKEKDNSELVRAFLTKNPKVTANRTAARLLFAQYPMRFKDIDNARSAVRSIMNAHGKLNRNYNMEKKATFLDHLAKLRAASKIEEADHADVTPYIINSRFKKILVIMDTHIPFQDMKALDLALEYAYNEKVDAVVFNGDFLDFNTISKYISKPNAPRMFDSIAQGIEVLKYIKAALGCKIIFHEGNHDIRCENYLIQKAPEFWQVPSVQLENLLELKKMNIDYVSNIRTMHYGKLVICHGNHIVKGIFSPVNPARGAFTKANSSIMIGHCHRSSEHIETDIKGKVTGCWSVGCLTSTTPEYNPQVSKHNKGFAVVTLIDKEGNFEVDNKKIIDYKVR